MGFSHDVKPRFPDFPDERARSTSIKEAATSGKVTHLILSRDLTMMKLWLLLALAAFAVDASFLPCTPCIGEECDQEPLEECRYGTTRNQCGQIVCAKGPGDRCGGRDNFHGKCGDGMDCRCGTCRGCSTHRFLKGYIDCEWNNHMCSS